MYLNLKLNARFQPKHRFELEDALQEVLEKAKMGEITGGGTALLKNREVAYCDIEISLSDSRSDGVEWLAGLLNRMGIPKGSLLQGGGPEIPVGTLEGLALYLNGTDLPEEVYKSCDVNLVVEELEKAMEGFGRMYSYWEGERETALYFYGPSFEKMKELAAPFLEKYPLCRDCRVERIA